MVKLREWSDEKKCEIVAEAWAAEGSVSSSLSGGSALKMCEKGTVDVNLSMCRKPAVQLWPGKQSFALPSSMLSRKRPKGKAQRSGPLCANPKQSQSLTSWTPGSKPSSPASPENHLSRVPSRWIGCPSCWLILELGDEKFGAVGTLTSALDVIKRAKDAGIIP